MSSGQIDLEVIDFSKVRPDFPPNDFVGPSIPFVRIDKMLYLAGLAESATDGQRKLKQGAVHINGEVQNAYTVVVRKVPMEFVVRVGKKLKRILIV